MRHFGWMAGLALAACSGDPSPTATSDAGRDVASDLAVTPDVADAAMTCDVGAPPVAMSALPMVRSRVVILGGDAGSAFPMASGGDPTGRWLITGATLYLPGAAQGQVDAARSNFTGTGWAVIEGSSYRIATELELVLETAMVGRVRRPAGILSRGTFTQQGANLMLMPACVGGSSSGGMVMLGMSRDAPNRGRLFAGLSGMLGMALIVFDMEAAP